MRTSLHQLVLAALLCLLAGCGGRDYETVPVSGSVTLDGKPLPNIGVMFVPLAQNADNPNVGPGSLGRTDEEGRFTLQTARGEKGAVPTEHVVRLSIADAAEPNEADFTPEGDLGRKPNRPVVKLPASAGDGSLRFKVPSEGTDQANFDLESR
jgi:hypothetical protein